MNKDTSLYPFDSNYLDFGGVRMHYLDEGKGAPVVMLHGNPSWSFMYRELVKTLKGSYRCIVPDHVGMGLSDKPDDDKYEYTLDRRVSDLEALLETLSIKEEITLVVHDWGGMIGMAYAVRHPERIKRIVVMNTAGFFPPGGKPIPLTLTLVRDTWLGPALVRGFNAFARFATRWCVTRAPMSKAVKAQYLAPYDSWKNRIATLRFVQDIPLHPRDKAYTTVLVTDQVLAERLKGIPMLIVWGEKDFVFTNDYRDEWVRRFPDAKLISIPDGGHYIIEDAPEQVIPAVEGFLANGSHVRLSR